MPPSSLFVHLGSFYASLALVYTLPFFASSPPSDDREAVKAHRRVSGGQSRSKCAARVRRANIELLKDEKSERRPRDKKRTKSPSLLHMSKKSSNFAAEFFV